MNQDQTLMAGDACPNCRRTLKVACTPLCKGCLTGHVGLSEEEVDAWRLYRTRPEACEEFDILEMEQRIEAYIDEHVHTA